MVGDDQEIVSGIPVTGDEGLGRQPAIGVGRVGMEIAAEKTTRASKRIDWHPKRSLQTKENPTTNGGRSLPEMVNFGTVA